MDPFQRLFLKLARGGASASLTTPLLRAAFKGNPTAQTLFDRQPGGYMRFRRLHNWRNAYFFGCFTVAIVGFIIEIFGGTSSILLGTIFFSLLGWIIFSTLMEYDDLLTGVRRLCGDLGFTLDELLQKPYTELQGRYHVRLYQLARLVITAEQTPGPLARHLELGLSDDEIKGLMRDTFRSAFDFAKSQPLRLIEPEARWNEFFQLAQKQGPFDLNLGEDRSVPQSLL